MQVYIRLDAEDVVDFGLVVAGELTSAAGTYLKDRT